MKRPVPMRSNHLSIVNAWPLPMSIALRTVFSLDELLSGAVVWQVYLLWLHRICGESLSSSARSLPPNNTNVMLLWENALATSRFRDMGPFSLQFHASGGGLEQPTEFMYGDASVTVSDGYINHHSFCILDVYIARALYESRWFNLV
ncbi:hypothetical protein CONPUDRAFT_73876 [Coniophora puteana RWD-64-598 SS2]|uniref:Uncharacterized protein n=1 Tax=Coniophora puteana (strain RWD-64-598) TaxID=741705 RepID=A0A5M3MP47_CONPW|nr:uncharacterized protein CONPUDRAFT_73876 [Coniophora puteana RWD-64-598 SS2]EIW80863.1 hypothetical protein CONPUDRAFT_73876 [Coniophora puteana RWD-64-598 SS2]